MGFFLSYLGHFKNFLKIFCILFVFLFCISCQNLNRSKKSNRKNSYTYQKSEKNFDFQKNDINSSFFTTKKNIQPIIDHNYFETQADSFYLKAEEAFFENDNQQALKHFKKALLYAPHSINLRKRVAQIYEQEGLLAEALNHYKTLSQTTAKNKKFHHKVIEIYKLNNMEEKALERYNYLLNQEPDNFSLRFEKALLFIHQANWPVALKTLKKAKTKAQNLEEKVQVLISQSYILVKLQNQSEYLKTMNELKNLQIDEEELVLKIAEFYESLNQNQTAITYLENFQKTQGVSLFTSKSLLKYYIASENWKKALHQLEQIQAFGQFENHHYFYMAILLLEKQNYDRALAFLKDLTAKEETNGYYRYLLAFVYEQKKDWKNALKNYNQVQSSSSHFLAAKLQTAQVLSQIGQKKKSLALLKQMAFLADGNINLQAVLFYAESLWDLGYKKKALDTLTKGLNQKPLYTDLLFLRGFYLKQMGQTDLALNDMNQILTHQKDHKEALNFVADFYSEQNIKLNTAETMARKALSLQPDSSYFLNTLGWVLFKKGNVQSALNYLSKAFSVDNKDSRIARRLSKVHLKLKNFKQSEYFSNEALKLEKKDKNNNKNFISTQASKQ